MLTFMRPVIASVAHESKIAVRVFATPSPESVSNVALSIGEDVLAIGLIWTALHFTLVATIVASMFLIVGVVIIFFTAKISRSMCGFELEIRPPIYIPFIPKR
jgi:hypothetical protein